MMQHLLGLDHVMVLVRDLDRAAEAWRSLGFTISPRGTHSPHMGTANHTMMLGPDYIELLGPIRDTEHNAASRARLAKHEGIERAAFTTDDAAAGAAILKSRGIAASGPIDFGRPVELPNGRKTEARFRVFQWPIEEAPGGLRIFACQHETRDAVWVPELQRHPNGAQRLLHVEVLADDAQGAAAHLGRLIDDVPRRDSDGGWYVPTGSGRGTFVFVDRETFVRRHPGVPLDGLPDEGGVGLAVQVGDLDAVASCVGPRGRRGSSSITVPPQAATGVLLEFVRA